ncbi:MAG TPA: hypothetical protein VMH01_09055 [Puia sp.]|nr:hypothetical protein [Puia sp.]
MLLRLNSVLWLFILILVSCRKTNSYHLQGVGIPQDNIYLAGQLDSFNIPVLKYWQKGSCVELTRSYGVNYNIGTSGIVAKGSDVYVCGFAPTYQTTYVALNSEALYWKNGTPVYLGDTSQPSYATSIAISGGDIYVAGCYSTPGNPGKAVYWKNGEEVALSGSSQLAVPTAIAVSGIDVYVTGAVVIEPNFAKYAAVIWKNGNMIYQGDTSMGGFATSLAINNGDVYAGGCTEFMQNGNTLTSINHAVYWKNGTAVNVPDTGYSSVVNAIAVSGGDIYAVGTRSTDPLSSPYYNFAEYWKNGTEFTLGNYLFSVATTIAVSGNDVYIGGRAEYQNFPGATYWKNGKPNYLNNGSRITAMCLPSP